MNDARALNRKYETMAWGAFFIWLGLTSFFRGLPEGVGGIGIGAILLGLNLARYLSKIPTSSLTIFLGAIALVFGLFDLARTLWRLQIDVPFFPLLLIVIGVVWLVRGLTHSSGQ